LIKEFSKGSDLGGDKFRDLKKRKPYFEFRKVKL